ncbi:angiomotin-like isoform X2 [Xenia sp. Carnegie-2017]|uniref:angiomotin-like isoform X2 n=1 Tax=Xenia sp. Carnegie-2017 TaxID=2897299 RepID=UPI001F0449E3|nr:angiomotin-like isoform X2 [Xenia sp. Carnegie-2017]
MFTKQIFVSTINLFAIHCIKHFIRSGCKYLCNKQKKGMFGRRYCHRIFSSNWRGKYKEASNTEKKKELTLGMVDDTDKETYQSNAISDCHEVASRATEIVQVFSEENMCLRKKLEKCYQEIKHLKSVEKELRESQIMYSDLKSAFIIREHKEKAMRSRMEAEIVQLRITNTELNDELKKLKALKSEIEVHDLRNQINQKDDQLKQLQKEKKFYKSSLTNLEKMLKQKSSEILMLQKQLKAPCMKNISTSLTKENNNGENGENKISNDFSEQFHDSMLRSSLGRTATKFEDRFHQRKNDRNAPMNSNVSVLIELLKEKDAQIMKFREEINDWEILQKRRHSKRRYSDLETEIRTLHVKLAEKDAQIKILECKYGENYADCKQLSTPFRIPSFEIHSSTSSYQDSGIITVSDSHGYEEIQETHNSKDERSSEEPLRHRNSDYDLAQRNEHEKTILSEYCWFV